MGVVVSHSYAVVVIKNLLLKVKQVMMPGKHSKDDVIIEIDRGRGSPPLPHTHTHVRATLTHSLTNLRALKVSEGGTSSPRRFLRFRKATT